MKTINIIRITCLITVLFIALPAVAQESQNKSEDAESKRLQEIIDKAWQESHQYSQIEKKDNNADHPNLKWARILFQYRIDHPENRIAAKATSEAIHLLFHADQYDEVRSKMDSLNTNDPAWIYLGEVLTEDANHRKDYSYLIDKALLIQNSANDNEIIRSITLTLGRAYRNNKNIDKAKSQFHSLIARYPNTPSAKAAERELLELDTLNSGQQAPIFAARSIDDKPVYSAKFKGRVLLLNFWLSTSKTCLQELPKLNKIYSTYKDRGLDILGISLDTNAKELVDNVASLKIPWPQVRDENIAKLFSVDSTPGYILLDRDGKIIAREASIEKLSEHISSQITKPVSSNSSPPSQSASSFQTSPRDKHMKPEEVLNAINVRPGSVIADIGAGDGYFTRRFAVAVSPKGRAIAIDINPQMVLKATADSRSYANYEARLVPADDPMLEPDSIDVVFVCATYHEIENRIEYFTRIKKSLRKDARLIIIDMDRSNADNKTHSIEKETVIRELESAGYKFIKENEILRPRHFFLEFKL